MYRPTREGDFLQELLKDFRGVLVSDFYAAYDSLECPQQKCLIHLMRDINQELLNNPFDEELQSITRAVRHAAAAIVDDHRPARPEASAPAEAQAATWRLLPPAVERTFRSEAAEALPDAAAEEPGQAVHLPRPRRRAVEQQQRRERDQAVRLLPGGHRATDKEAGLNDYLVLLSIYQTCRYKGVSFLKFLVVGAAGHRQLLREEAIQVGPPSRFTRKGSPHPISYGGMVIIDLHSHGRLTASKS